MRLQNVLLLTSCIAAALAFTTADAGSIRGISDQNTEMVPTGKGIGRPAKPGELADGRQIHDFARIGGARHTSGNGINYNGGPIMTGTPNVYVIWYGNWSGNSAVNLMTALLSNIGPSPYYNINTTYYNGAGTHLSNSIHYAGSSNDAYSQGTALSDANIATIVQSKISAGAFPSDTNGLYMVLTSADVNETSGFCTQYCGWHNHGSIVGADIKYAFVGNPDRCPSSCAAQTTSSPNNNIGGDGMASIVSHELEEATSDPDLNAWYDSRGRENADKCAWTFGTESTASNGSLYNMVIGGYQFLIQQNWVNAAGGYCAKSY